MTLESNNKSAIRLRFLNDISTRLQSLLDAENFYQEIVNTIHEKLKYYSVHIWNTTTLPDGRPAAVLLAQAGAYAQHLNAGETIALKLAGITGHVLMTGKTYLSNDVSSDPLFTNLSFPVSSKSELSVPILSPTGQILGALGVESDQINAFDDDDIQALSAVASQVSVAIANRTLFNEVKDFNEKLQAAVESKTLALQAAQKRILEQQKLLQRENKVLKNLVSHDQKKTFEIVGESPVIKNILSMVEKIAPTTASVLIQGESGTGKELVARRLHILSERSEKPYVTVNCGALQESLLESELFGHEKGAFTGAVAQKIGLVETADGGTLFLDEIGEMSLSIQVKLLRFLQEGEFYRIGGKRPLRVNVRVISASNRDLEQEVKEGRFREDLFYRLNTITLRVPPLRKRKEDLPILMDYFFTASQFGRPSHSFKISPNVVEIFKNYDWPGNIRELQNTIERMKILAESNQITVDDVPFNIRVPKDRAESNDFTVDMSLEDLERNHILRALAYHRGNKTKTAQSLGITIKTLYNKLHRYGLLTTQNVNSDESTVVASS